MSKQQLTLGQIIRGIRTDNKWTLKEMSLKTGIPVSTLSKVEHNRLTLTYDKLQQLSLRLNIRMSELFAENETSSNKKPIMARRSLGTSEDAFQVKTDNYDYYYLCTELRRKRMIPIITKVRAQSVEQFGALEQHQGEEFIYVIKGSIEVHTDFYDVITLTVGQSIYLDSTMGHAYIAADGCEEAVVLGVCSSEEEGLMDSLVNLNENGI